MNSIGLHIHGLGGPAQVARRLGFPLAIGTQRVSNWIARGSVPLKICVDHPDLFPMSLYQPLADRPSAVSSC